MRIIPASESAELMRSACIRFLETLTPELLRKALFDFETAERQRWHYVPREMFDRKGVCLKDMNEKQQKTALGLLASGLSKKGYKKAKAIMELETILGEIERSIGDDHLIRDPGLYYFSVFGDPTNVKPWSWRAEGHHVSLHFTVVHRDLVSNYPFFLGANPAAVHHGTQKGLRILSAEEDLARQLLSSLNREQKGKAIISTVAPDDILSRAAPKVEFEAVEGLAAESMTSRQREMLLNLLLVYIDRLPEELAVNENKKLKDFTHIHFAWAGADEPGRGHYYRLHGPLLFIEYDNTQNNANHIHTVWRHLEDDFGMDLLNLHYKRGHHPMDC